MKTQIFVTALWATALALSFWLSAPSTVIVVLLSTGLVLNLIVTVSECISKFKGE